MLLKRIFINKKLLFCVLFSFVSLFTSDSYLFNKGNKVDRREIGAGFLFNIFRGFRGERFSNLKFKIGKTLNSTILGNSEKVITGEEIEYYESGKILYRAEYKNGKKDGVWIVWHKNEKIKILGSYSNGYPIGLWTRWYENGLKEIEGHYLLGLLNGVFTEWYSNGQKMSSSYYVHGEKNGWQICWNSKGRIVQKGKYKNGKKIGKWSEFYYKDDPSWIIGARCLIPPNFNYDLPKKIVDLSLGTIFKCCSSGYNDWQRFLKIRDPIIDTVNAVYLQDEFLGWLATISEERVFPIGHIGNILFFYENISRNKL